MADEWDQFEPADDTQELSAKNYGPVVGEYHHDAMYGPDENPLGESDVAVSPDTGLELGDVIKARGKNYTVADWSYYHPGKPTSQTVEFRDAPADGNVIVEKVDPWAGFDVPSGKKAEFTPGEVRRALPYRDVRGNIIQWDKPASAKDKVPPRPLTAQERDTFAAPEGSPERQQLNKSQPLTVNQIPSLFAQPNSITNVVEKSMSSLPGHVPDEQDFIPQRPGDIGTRSLEEAFQTGGIVGAGAYLGGMQALPLTAEATRLAFKMFPQTAQLSKIADAFPTTAPGKVAKGLEDSVVDSVTMLSSPTNMALMATGQALPGVAGRIVTGWFMGQMARQFPDEWKAFTASTDIGEKTKILSDMALQAGIIYGGAKSMGGEPVDVSGRIKATALAQERAQTAAMEGLVEGGEPSAETTGTKTEARSRPEAPPVVAGQEEGVHIRDTPQDRLETETAKVGIPEGMINAVRTPTGNIVGHGIEHGDVISKLSEKYDPEELTSGWVLKRPTKAETDETFVSTGDVQKTNGDFDAAFRNKEWEGFEQSLPEEEPLYGMGAAAATEVLRPDEPTAKQLADLLNDDPTGDPMTFTERVIGARQRAGEAIGNATQRSFDIVKNLSKGFKKHQWDAPTPTNFDRVKGKWDASRQNSELWIKDLGKKLEKKVPRLSRQEAIYNWASADGDEALLNQWADKAPPDTRQGYLDALKLNDEEKRVGNLIRSAYDDWLQQATENGMLKSGVEDYLKRVVKSRPEVEQGIMSRISTGRLSTNFRESKKRFWKEMVDAEKEGVRYDKRLRGTSLYAQSFERTAINRKFVKSMFETVMTDGLPALTVAGDAMRLDSGEKPSPSLLVTPYGKRAFKGQSDLKNQLMSKHPTWSEEHANSVAKDQILLNYKPINVDAFQNFQWVHTLDDGTDVFVRGNALAHKDIHAKLENAFVQDRILWLEPLLRAQGFVKGSKLSLSAFHQVHEMANAFGHLSKVVGLKSLEEYMKNPVIQAGMEGGLKLVGDAAEQAAFAEGMGSHGWPEMVPGLGKYVRAYKDWLFENYIPRLKAEAYTRAYQRNVSGGLLGAVRPDVLKRGTAKLTPEQNAIITANQINASFGELNYRQMMRDPRLQQTLQGLFLAPDFGESKLRHMGQVFTRYGGEQRMGLGMVAGTLWFGARALNQAINGNPHWDKPFAVVIGDRQYTMRSFPGDMYHLFTDWQGYTRNRLSPVLQNTVEMLYKHDAQGHVVDWSDISKDMVLSAAPISLTTRKGLNWKDNLASAMGITPMPYRYETELNKKISDWRKNSKDPKLMREYERRSHTANLPSDYAPMRDALRDGNLQSAQNEYQKLQKGGRKPAEIEKAMRKWAQATFTGGKETETRFRKTLNKRDMELYNKAKTERRFIFGQFRALQRGASYQAYPAHLEK